MVDVRCPSYATQFSEGFRISCTSFRSCIEKRDLEEKVRSLALLDNHMVAYTYAPLRGVQAVITSFHMHLFCPAF